MRARLWPAVAFAVAMAAGTAIVQLLLPSELDRVPAVSGALYLLFVIAQARRQGGAIVVFAAGVVVWAALDILDADPLTRLLAHAGILATARALLFCRVPSARAAEAGVAVLSVVATCFAANHASSAALLIWTYYLAQAASVLIPPDGFRRRHRIAANAFSDARRRAESALVRLQTAQSASKANIR